MTTPINKQKPDLDATSGRDQRLVRWVFKDDAEGKRWELTRPDGSFSAATVWVNGTWHTWDVDGVGGENSREGFIETAKYEATMSALNQGFLILRTQSPPAANKTQIQRKMKHLINNMRLRRLKRMMIKASRLDAKIEKLGCAIEKWEKQNIHL